MDPFSLAEAAAARTAARPTCDPGGTCRYKNWLHISLKRQTFWALSIALLVAPASSAQTPTDGGPDPAIVRVRLGPLWLTPTVSMPNLGIDTNVFNDPLNVTPKRDFTFDVLPKTDLWLRMGRTWLLGTVAEEVIWYQTYTTERSVNGTYSIG